MTLPTQGGRADRLHFSLGLSASFAAFFFVIGIILPFLPLWLAAKGLSDAEISAVIAAPMLTRVLVTPALGLLIDRSADRRRALIVLAVIGTLSFAALFWTDGFWAILLVSLLGAAVWHPLMAAMESLAQAGQTRYGLDYGRLRLWGSVTFILANLAGGAAVGLYGPVAVIALMTLSALATVLSLAILPRQRREGAAARGLGLDAYLDWMRRPGVVWFVLGVGLLQSSHALYYAFGTIHWESLGYRPSTIGVLWAVGVVAEIALFAVAGWVLARLGVRGLLAAAGLGAVLRWGLTALDPALAALFVIQLGHALTFGATHLAGVTMIARIAPEAGGGSAQAFYFTLAGVVMGLMTLAAGPLYATFSGQAYWAMAGVGAMGAVIALFAARRLLVQPQSAGDGGATVAPS